jgi:hypothetical protein
LNVQEFLISLANWVGGTINEANEVKPNELWRNVGLVFIMAYERINSIQFQRHANNSPFIDPYALSSVLPHELVKTTTSDFFRINTVIGCNIATFLGRLIRSQTSIRHLFRRNNMN